MLKMFNITESIMNEPLGRCDIDSWKHCVSRYMCKFLFHTFVKCSWQGMTHMDDSIPEGWSYQAGSYEEFVHMLVDVFFELKGREEFDSPVIWNTFSQKWKADAKHGYAISVSRSLLQRNATVEDHVMNQPPNIANDVER